MSVLVILLGFQNCSDFAPMRGEISNGLTGLTQESTALNSAGSCLLGNTVVQSGTSINAFSNTSVAANQSCDSIKQVRNCLNGVLDGDSAYSQTYCNQSTAKSCIFNGQTLVSGASVIMYMQNKLPFGSNCDSSSNRETRVCVDGAMTGSASYPSCSVDQASSCNINGKVLAHGTSQVFYNSPVIQYGTGSCLSQTRTCNNGNADGQYIYTQCEVVTRVESIPLGPCLSNNRIGTYYSLSRVCGHPNYWAQANGTEKLEYRTDASGTEVWGINIPNPNGGGYDTGYWQCAGMALENRMLCKIPPGQSSCTYDEGGGLLSFTASYPNCGNNLQYQPPEQPSYDTGGSGGA